MLAQRLGPQAEQRGQRHAVHVAGGRGLRRVDVGVGIDPEHADLLALAAVELGHAGDRAGGQRVVAAQHQRRHALFQGLDHRLGGAGAGLGDFLQIARVFVAEALGLGDLHADVAAVGDLVAERLKARLQGRPRAWPRGPCPRRGGWRPCPAGRRRCESGGGSEGEHRCAAEIETWMNPECGLTSKSLPVAAIWPASSPIRQQRHFRRGRREIPCPKGH